MFANDVEEMRDQLDDVDLQILRLYEERMRICRDIGEYKIERGQKVFHKQRERDKLSRMVSMAESDFDKKAAKEIFEQFMALSRKMQYQMLTEKGALGRLPFIGIDELDWSNSRIVYQGTEGAYSQEALKKYFGHEVNSFSVHTFRDAMEAIEEGSADFAVLPIENSTAGAVDQVFDLLVEFENYIVDDLILPIHHNLAVYPGTSNKDIKRVYSHPQALMQSARYLESHRDWQQISVLNTAVAAKKIQDDQDNCQAAICSTYAAEIHGLEVLEKNINDNPNNSTRFIVVTNQKVFLKDAKKISICFEVAHESGSLYHLLSHFIYNNLNMTKIESRPIEGQSWEYRFFVDFDGNMAEPAVKNAIRGLREEARNLKILGNY